MAGRWIPNPAAVEWAFDQRVGDAAAKFVLVILARHASAEWSCTPGQPLLAEATEQSLSSVSRALKRLEKDDFIKRTPRYDEKGYRTSDLYRLNPSLALPVNLPSSQIAYQADCRRKSSLSEKTPKEPKGGVGGSSSARKPETKIPDIFPVTQQMLAWVKNHQKVKFTVDIEVETERFINNAHLNDRRCRDWFAAWRNWMLKGQEMADQRRKSTGTEGWSHDNVRETTGSWDV